VSRARAYSSTVRHAAELLGAQVRQARIEQRWTVRELAERAGISAPTLLKVERGDPSVALGTAFDLAVLTGVPLFFDERARLGPEAARAQERAVLLGRRVRPSRAEPDYDF
jgi:transcriptional regulator with XRE-family HTH domain